MIDAFPGTDPRLLRCHRIRRIVFIEEQDVPEEEEIDGRDLDCIHVLLVSDGQDLGTARLRSVDGGRVAKVERVAVHRDARGAGWGAWIMRALHGLAARSGAQELLLGAQLTALGFYERLGYRAEGPVFDDAGIDHRRMRRPVLASDWQDLPDGLHAGLAGGTRPAGTLASVAVDASGRAEGAPAAATMPAAAIVPAAEAADV